MHVMCFCMYYCTQCRAEGDALGVSYRSATTWARIAKFLPHDWVAEVLTQRRMTVEGLYILSGTSIPSTDRERAVAVIDRTRGKISAPYVRTVVTRSSATRADSDSYERETSESDERETSDENESDGRQARPKRTDEWYGLMHADVSNSVSSCTGR